MHSFTLLLCGKTSSDKRHAVNTTDSLLLNFDQINQNPPLVI